MNANSSAVVIYVFYQGTPQTRFDRDYYVKSHLPFCMESWQQYGLQTVSAFYPALDQGGTIAICECVFRDEAAVEAAFNSPEVPAVMADVARYTDATPVRVRGVPL
jgi:uncharacterized protein (TIGR02118 family)